MILDYQNKMSDAQAITSTGATASTNILDLGDGGDLGNSNMELFVRCATAVTSAGSATVTFALQTDSDSAFGSPVTLFTTAAIAKTTLVQYYEPMKIKIPYNCERYIRMLYTIGTAVLTAGSFDAELIIDRQTNEQNFG